MTNKEKYYTRAYSTIKQIETAFPRGIDGPSIRSFIQNKMRESTGNKKLVSEEEICFVLTMLITLIGLNKEEIEEAYDIKYKRNIVEHDIFELFNSDELNNLKQELENIRTFHTDFDNWLVVTKNLTNKNTNYDYLKMVRNALLHSEFEVIFDSVVELINIKNKSFFEANLVYQNFFQFITRYFSNNMGLGLTTKNILFSINPNIKIENQFDLINFLSSMDIYFLTLDNSDDAFYDGILYKYKRKDNTIDLKMIEELEGKVKDFYSGNLSQEMIKRIVNYINIVYGTRFYKEWNYVKRKHIVELCQLLLDPKNYFSCWIAYIIDVIYKLKNAQGAVILSEFNISPEGFLITICIIKSYLILYRLQCNEFSDIDYDKFDFDFDVIQLVSTNETQYLNLQKKYSNIDNETLKKMYILQIFRNALSHGNINVYVVNNVNHTFAAPIIEFVDSYKTSVSKIRLPLDDLIKFLNSEAFLPEYCYQEEKQKKL